MSCFSSHIKHRSNVTKWEWAPFSVWFLIRFLPFVLSGSFSLPPFPHTCSLRIFNILNTWTMHAYVKLCDNVHCKKSALYSLYIQKMHTPFDTSTKFNPLTNMFLQSRRKPKNNTVKKQTKKNMLNSIQISGLRVGIETCWATKLKACIQCYI